MQGRNPSPPRAVPSGAHPPQPPCRGRLPAGSTPVLVILPLDLDFTSGTQFPSPCQVRQDGYSGLGWLSSFPSKLGCGQHLPEGRPDEDAWGSVAYLSPARAFFCDTRCKQLAERLQVTAQNWNVVSLPVTRSPGASTSHRHRHPHRGQFLRHCQTCPPHWLRRASCRGRDSRAQGSVCSWGPSRPCVLPSPGGPG